MIDSRDLRINNLLICKNQLSKVTEIYHDSFWVVDINTKLSYSSYQQHIKPIKITAAILEQVGFVKLKESDDDISIYERGFMRNNMRVQIQTKHFDIIILFEFQLCGFNEISGINECRYLHQLKNLYYSLTKQELPIDINTLKV